MKFYNLTIPDHLSTTLALQVKIIDSWNEDFFQQFIELRNQLYKEDDHFIAEDIERFKLLFRDSYEILNRIWIWRALLIFKISESGPIAIGRILVCYNTLNPHSVLNCGYFETIDNYQVCKLLFDNATEFAQEHNISSLKTPIDANFFVSYRIKISGNGEPFYGEPIYQDYYHSFFKEYGFLVCNTWYTTKAFRFKALKNFKRIDQSLKGRINTYQKLQIRRIDFSRWDEELLLLHDLFNRSFNEMPEYEPISFSTFKELNSSLKYIACPFFSLIVEYNSKPVGFAISFFDPLKIILKAKKIEKFLNKYFSWPIKKINTINTITKILTLIMLKLNHHTLLALYVGRVPTSESGVEIKGIQAKLSRHMIFGSVLLLVKKILICYASETSGSNRSYKNDSRTNYATYVLYKKDLYKKDLYKKDLPGPKNNHPK
ncbi:MAG: hypothetical protein HQK49_07480 [Oligoflexia bacterium]|nr:hypothetical protein [Oligoflexia bacterium]